MAATDLLAFIHYREVSDLLVLDLQEVINRCICLFLILLEHMPFNVEPK